MFLRVRNIERDGFIIDLEQYIYNWDDSECREENEQGCGGCYEKVIDIISDALMTGKK